jgi:arsenite-transporting ATPase
MRVIYFTGKGGTGKSVISSATALRTSEYGYKTLLMSSDPAHSLRDVLGVAIGRDPTKVCDNFYAVNIDPIKEAIRHYSVILDYIASVFKARGLDEILAYELAALPGMTGVASMLMLDKLAKEDEYDIVIIDTVPSGEALRYLYIPSLLGKISRRFMKLAYPLADIGKIVEPIVGIPAPPREMIKKEVELIEMIDRVKDILINHDITSVRLVANPDSFSIGNVRRTFIQSSIYGLNTDLIIMNKVLPKDISDPYFYQWLSDQEKYIIEAVNSFKPIPVKFLKLFRSELKGIEMLREAAIYLYQDEDPTVVYYKGKKVEIRRDDGVLEIRYPTPLISKEEIGLERIGDELIVKLYTDAGPVDLVVPLPTITFKMRIKKASLKNGYLIIIFEGEEIE